jgi:hypothetical protein
LAYSYFTFGHVLPNSVSVKAVQHSIGWFKTQPPWFIDFLSQPKLPWITYPLAILGGYDAARDVKDHRGRFVLLLVAFGLVQVVAYSFMNAPVGYFWYMAPGNMALDLMIVLGAFRASGWAWDRMARMHRRIPLDDHRLILSAIVVLCVSKLAMSPMKPIKPFRLGQEYTEAGEWINAHTRKEDVVAAAEIGYLGYYSQRQIRDIHGLIHPYALPFLKREEWDWWFRTDAPQVIVTHSPPWPGEPFWGGWSARSTLDFENRYVRSAAFGQVQIYEQQHPAVNGTPTQLSGY